MASFAALVNQAAGSVAGLAGFQVSESARQLATEDGKYYREAVAFFELVQPGRPSFLFPLICGVSQYQLQEPYALEVVPTDYAGLGIQRSGVVQRRLQISGHTGFAPKPLPIGNILPSPSSAPPNYAPRGLPAVVLAPLSGQKIFQYLQEAVFRRYSELCRDPTTAAGTKLLFHDPRDDEHWQVEPQSFTLARGPQSNFTYPYAIDLVIVGPAAPAVFPLPATDRGVLDRLTDTVAEVTDALSTLSGAIDDLSRVQASFKVLGQKVAGIIDAGTTVVQAASAFVNGTQSLINVPLTSVYALFGLCAEVCALYGNLVDLATAPTDWPSSVLAQFRALQNACDQLIGQTRVFSPPFAERLDTLGQPVAPNRLANLTTATTFEGIRAAGTANLPGSAAALAATDAAAVARPVYRSVRQVAVQQGDTLQIIAARELGSTGLWRDLATLNDLKPPYSRAGDRQAASPAQADAATGALTYGRPLLVPSTDPPPQVRANPAVLGVAPTAPQPEQAYGRGLTLVRLANSGGDPLYDLDLGATDGLADLATTAGVDNLAQVAEQGVVTPRGGNPMFPDFGLEGLVGTGIADVDDTLRDYRITQALLADPRITAISALTISRTLAGDGLLVDAQAVAQGNSDQATVRFTF